MIGPKANTDAEVFANALDGHGPRNNEFRDLVRFAESLCESAVDPTLEFTSGLRSQLMADAATVLVKSPAATDRLHFGHSTVVRHPVRRRLAAATAALIASSGLVGIVASSAQAIPGDMLYPVKRGVESVELSLHRGDASRGSFQLAQASERLAEAHSLSTQNDSRSKAAISKALDEFSDSATAGSSSLFENFAEEGNAKSIDRVGSFASTSGSVLESMSANLPAESTDAFKVASSALSDMVTQATTLCAACNVASLPAGLTSSVARILHPAKVSTGTDQSKPLDQKKNDSTPTNPVAGLIGTVTPTVKPKPPTSQTTTAPPSIGDVTTPLVGALLGNDTQPGLVPGLLGGLLGGGKK